MLSKIKGILLIPIACRSKKMSQENIKSKKRILQEIYPRLIVAIVSGVQQIDKKK